MNSLAMVQELQVNLRVEDVDLTGQVRPEVLKRSAAQALGLPEGRLNDVALLRLSLDARSKMPCYQARVRVYTDDSYRETLSFDFSFSSSKDASFQRIPSRKVIVAGMGPAGLFAALALASAGVQVVLLERGKPVKERKRDIAAFCRSGLLNPESNYSYGEGGAGCFSDGKLYTRSNKRGDIGRVLRIFVHYGAKEEILYQAHPHLGSDRMPGMIEKMRQDLLSAGAEIRFETKVESILRDAKGGFAAVLDQHGNEYPADALVLAVGNAAGELWQKMASENILLEEKPFAMGVRLEHPQALVNAMQYRGAEKRHSLPTAEYSFVEQVDGRGVFSFCMCPGGVVIPAATEQDGLVVNGMSDSGRNSLWANAGWVTGVDRETLRKAGVELEAGPLALWYYQRQMEQRFYRAGVAAVGQGFAAPAQRLTDFMEGRLSASLPRSSYPMGVYPTLMEQLLPPFISQALHGAFRRVSAKKRAFLTEEAVLLGLESRTSSPVRIPRMAETGEHPQVPGLYPCGEGSGYAGGITSSAIDGLNCAEKILAKWGIGATFGNPKP